MDKKKWFTVGGVAGIVVGSIALFIGGGTVGVATEIVGATFVLIGIIAGVVKDKLD